MMKFTCIALILGTAAAASQLEFKSGTTACTMSYNANKISFSKGCTLEPINAINTRLNLVEDYVKTVPTELEKLKLDIAALRADVKEHHSDKSINSCWEVRSKATGEYKLKSGKTVWCDNSYGGGWTLVVKIDGNDQEHSYTGARGDAIVKPTTSRTSKYTDSEINNMMTKRSASYSSIRFLCARNPVAFFKQCSWSSTQASARSSSCLQSYHNQEATSRMQSHNCNAGSQGVGVHCGGHSGYAASYCSHCTNGAWQLNLGRNGCGHDSAGYGRQGWLYVR